jgi:hypothetical protein
MWKFYHAVILENHATVLKNASKETYFEFKDGKMFEIKVDSFRRCCCPC